MNDEIKEILDYLKIENGHCSSELSYEETHLLSDYITNLQQDLENYVNIVLHERKVIEDYKSRIEKAVDYIKQNCIASDKWEDLGFCNFVPTGEITYKQLNKSKIIRLLNILNGKE